MLGSRKMKLRGFKTCKRNTPWHLSKRRGVFTWGPRPHLTSTAELLRTSPSQFQELLEAAQLHGGWSLQSCPNRFFPRPSTLLSSSPAVLDTNWNFLTR